MDGLQDLRELGLGRRILEDIVRSAVDVGVLLGIEHPVEAGDPRLGVALGREARTCGSAGKGE